MWPLGGFYEKIWIFVEYDSGEIYSKDLNRKDIK